MARHKKTTIEFKMPSFISIKEKDGVKVKYFKCFVPAYSPSSEIIRHQLIGKTEEELTKKVFEHFKNPYIKPKNDKNSIGRDCTLGEWVTYWLEHVIINDDIGGSSYCQYSTQCKANIIPDIGHLNLREITPIKARDYINSLYEPGARKDGIKDKGYSERSVKSIHALLKRCLNAAKSDGLIDKNPLDGVKVRKLPKNKPPMLTDKHIQSILNIAKDHRLYMALVVLLFTGLRRGELLALKWEDVYFDHNPPYLLIRRGITKKRNGEWVIKNQTKTARERIVPIPAIVAEMLKSHRTKLLELFNAVGGEQKKCRGRRKNGTTDQDTIEDKGFVFPSMAGDFLNPESLKDVWEVWIEKAGIPHITPHGLRHLACSRLVSMGFDVTSISEMTGHDPTVLLNVYSHAMPEAFKNISHTMNEFATNNLTI